MADFDDIVRGLGEGAEAHPSTLMVGFGPVMTGTIDGLMDDLVNEGEIDDTSEERREELIRAALVDTAFAAARAMGLGFERWLKETTGQDIGIQLELPPGQLDALLGQDHSA